MMDVILNDFLDLIFDLFRIVCATAQLLGITGGIAFVVLLFYIGATRKGQYFLKWLNDEFGL